MGIVNWESRLLLLSFFNSFCTYSFFFIFMFVIDLIIGRVKLGFLQKLMSKPAKLCWAFWTNTGFFGSDSSFGLKIHIFRCQIRTFFYSGRVGPADRATDNQV